MENGTYINYLALNQNILGKPLVIGSAPKEGTEQNPILSHDGLKIYLNGRHNLSEFLDENFELEEIFSLGEMFHPNAMIGMPGSSGMIKYEFGISNEFYVIVVRLKLDEATNGKSDEAVAILSLIKKSEIPESFDYGGDNNYFLAKGMLLSHFDYLFQFYDDYKQIIEEGFHVDEELALGDIVKYHFDLKQSIQDMENELRKD